MSPTKCVLHAAAVIQNYKQEPHSLPTESEKFDWVHKTHELTAGTNTEVGPPLVPDPCMRITNIFLADSLAEI